MRGDITSHIHELAEIIDLVRPGLVAGICIDTCHAFSAGYDISTAEGVDALAEEIGRCCGRDMLRLVHLNDSKKRIGSGVDRHEHIGEGAIGKKGYGRLGSFLKIPQVSEGISLHMFMNSLKSLIW